MPYLFRWTGGCLLTAVVCAIVAVNTESLLWAIGALVCLGMSITTGLAAITGQGHPREPQARQHHVRTSGCSDTTSSPGVRIPGNAVTTNNSKEQINAE